MKILPNILDVSGSHNLRTLGIEDREKQEINLIRENFKGVFLGIRTRFWGFSGIFEREKLSLKIN